jgi:hypothetical protein
VTADVIRKNLSVMGKLEGMWAIRILEAKRRMGLLWGQWECISKIVFHKGQQWATCGWIDVSSELVYDPVTVCIFLMALANGVLLQNNISGERKFSATVNNACKKHKIRQ